MDKKEKQKIAFKKWYDKNKDQQKCKARERYLLNIKERKEYSKEYYKKNTNIVRKAVVESRKKKPDVYKKYLNEYIKNRRRVDDIFRISGNMRSRIYRAFKEGGYSKNSSTFKLLGCDFSSLKSYIKKILKENMSWENYGEWEIDHIIPLSSARSIEDIQNLCHFSNLQPLWKVENIKKGSKIL